MKLIALSILVLVLVPLCVHSNSRCAHSGFVTQKFGALKNHGLKMFFHKTVDGIKDEDCMLSYNVTLGTNKFYPYHFQLRKGTRHIYGMLNVQATTVQHILQGEKLINFTEYTYFWNRVSSKLFDEYYYKCPEDKNNNESLPAQLEC